MVDLPKDPSPLQKCHKIRLLSLSCAIHRKLTGSLSQEALFSDLCLKISPNVTNTSLNNNVLSLRLAGEYWREVCGASRRSGPAFAGGSAVAGRGPCLLLLAPGCCYLPERRTSDPANHPFLDGADVLDFSFVLCIFHVYPSICSISRIFCFSTSCDFYLSTGFS